MSTCPIFLPNTLMPSLSRNPYRYPTHLQSFITCSHSFKLTPSFCIYPSQPISPSSPSSRSSAVLHSLPPNPSPPSSRSSAVLHSLPPNPSPPSSRSSAVLHSLPPNPSLPPLHTSIFLIFPLSCSSPTPSQLLFAYISPSQYYLPFVPSLCRIIVVMGVSMTIYFCYIYIYIYIYIYNIV